jgi:hypothetical protein
MNREAFNCTAIETVHLWAPRDSLLSVVNSEILLRLHCEIDNNRIACITDYRLYSLCACVCVCVCVCVCEREREIE